MNKKLVSIILLMTSFLLLNAQDDEDEFEPSFSFGINLGAHFANKNTALLYSGDASQTQWGILRTMDLPLNQQRIRNYFQNQPYQVVELPLESRFRTTFEIGMHFNYQLSPTFSIFADLNSLRLEYEQFMTIEVNNPNNSSPQDDLERFPVIGEENRFNLNLGFQYNYYYEEGLMCYLSFLGNVNDAEMRRNYFVINNFEYEIQHPVDGDFTRKPGGVGYGGGIGTGLKFRLGYKIYADLYYTMLYTKTYMSETLQPYGTHHSLGLRIIWQSKDDEIEEDY